jgi:hypothetical protein
MMRKSFTIRHIAGRFGDVATSAYAFANAAEDIALFELAAELDAADHMLQAAKTELASAERRLQRLAALPAQDLPDWFTAREEAEAAAQAVIESLCEEIAAKRVSSRAGLAIKLRVLAAILQDDPTPISDGLASEGTHALLQSIFKDGGLEPSSGTIDNRAQGAA